MDIYYLIFILLGLSNAVFLFLYLRLSKFGTLVVDYSDPEKDIFRLEIDNIRDIDKKNKVLLKVKVINPDSQE